MKFFSRKQEVPALSSAEAEIISIVETAKEMVSLGMLLQTMIQGIALDPLGMPLQTTGEMGLRMFNDAKAAISMGKIDGLFVRNPFGSSCRFGSKSSIRLTNVFPGWLG